MPCLADVPQRRHEHGLDQLDDAGAVVDETAGELAHRRLVAVEQRVVHQLRMPLDPLTTGGGASEPLAFVDPRK